ncbi:conserved hypothetical protein [Candidatus Desulfarcum epimagneticum]|uniref:Elp3/MiaA/NifB-like radical SAM core domain-containing protein n=1 Tax=uncultured Desulfobacteraceae bacterium TaxID=218296 RepID=A0A484HFK2_9BACT|nr:conserved hypothetical protein [uncultured Desulfobacteraceae bacterium]
MEIATCSRRPVLVPCGLKIADYQVDPYVGCAHHCHYCYALNQAETDWTRKILTHPDIETRLAEALEKIPPQNIYMGYYTDPYQPCEAECLQTRKILESLLEKGFTASILTKSDLVLRDLDLLRRMGKASVSVSVAFSDNRDRERFEADTKDTEDRIEALRKLREAGVKTSALLCPVIPHVTDAAPLIDRLEPLADTIWIYGLNMERRSDRNWRNLKAIFKEFYPDLREEIEEIVFSKDHPFWTRLRRDLEKMRKERGLNLSVHV